MGASVHNALTSFAWAVPAALALTGLMKVGQLIYQHFHKTAVGGMEIPSIQNVNRCEKQR
ncbi:hypothetical protein RBB77_01735 [Tunturibacter psychrotolerans]|uniref:Uncharacterized protein n=1 Tax=Tunturiibacter psychrotolerans TaxID=3069686 RepID=A0AAU7ZRT1_9BACT